MDLKSVAQRLSEGGRYPGGRGQYRTVKASRTKGFKSKIPVYKTINQALRKASPGDIVSTERSGRPYVISKHKWGKKRQQTVDGKIAKGFTKGSATPSADWSSIRDHAARTKSKHGGSRLKSHTAKERRKMKAKAKIKKSRRK